LSFVVLTSIVYVPAVVGFVMTFDVAPITTVAVLPVETSTGELNWTFVAPPPPEVADTALVFVVPLTVILPLVIDAGTVVPDGNVMMMVSLTAIPEVAVKAIVYFAFAAVVFGLTATVMFATEVLADATYGPT
jgi:hypothetical protein